MHLLEAFVVHFSFIASDRVPQASIVSGVYYGAAYLPEARFSWHYKQRCIEQRMILTQILFSLVTKIKNSFG